MERVSFVGVIECYLGWIHTFVTESDTIVPVQSFLFIYTICVHQHLQFIQFIQFIQFTTLNIQLHPVNILLVVSRAVQVLSKYLGPSCHCQTCIRSLYVHC